MYIGKCQHYICRECYVGLVYVSNILPVRGNSKDSLAKSEDNLILDLILIGVAVHGLANYNDVEIETLSYHCESPYWYYLATNP